MDSLEYLRIALLLEVLIVYDSTQSMEDFVKNLFSSDCEDYKWLLIRLLRDSYLLRDAVC